MHNLNPNSVYTSFGYHAFSANLKNVFLQSKIPTNLSSMQSFKQIASNLWKIEAIQNRYPIVVYGVMSDSESKNPWTMTFERRPILRLIQKLLKGLSVFSARNTFGYFFPKIIENNFDSSCKDQIILTVIPYHKSGIMAQYFCKRSRSRFRFEPKPGSFLTG